MNSAELTINGKVNKPCRGKFGAKIKEINHAIRKI